MFSLAFAFASSPSVAFADWDSPRFTAAPSPPRVPAPHVLPELSHPRFDFGVDWFVARLASQDVPGHGAMVGILRPSVEASVLAPRRIFMGLTYPIAWALPPDGGLAPGEVGASNGTRMLPGNLEGHMRVVFPLPTSLESGLTLGVVVPTATFERSTRSDRSASEAAATVDPTNYIHFQPARVALRPAGDLRLVRDPFIFQARHGIDILIDDAAVDSAKVAGRLLGHAGYLLRSNAEISIEASQVYFFSSDEKAANAFAERYRISDQRRAAFTLGPALRLSYPEADLGLAFVTSVGNPLSPAASSFVGMRLSVISHHGSSR